MHEDTREPIHSPVRRAMQTGEAVTPGHPSVLIGATTSSGQSTTPPRRFAIVRARLPVQSCFAMSPSAASPNGASPTLVLTLSASSSTPEPDSDSRSRPARRPRQPDFYQTFACTPGDVEGRRLPGRRQRRVGICRGCTRCSTRHHDRSRIRQPRNPKAASASLGSARHGVLRTTTRRGTRPARFSCF